MLIPRGVFPISDLCDTDSSRFALGGVLLERDENGKAKAVATDGRRLLVISWVEDDRTEYPEGVADSQYKRDFRAIVPKKQWTDAEKLPPRNCPKPILSNVLADEPNANGSITLGATDLETARTIKAKCLEGNYPKYRDVIPEYKYWQSTRISVNRQLLESILHAMRGVTTEENTAVVLDVPFDPSKPLVLTAENDRYDAKGVLMPLAFEDSRGRTDLDSAVDDARIAGANCCMADVPQNELWDDMFSVLTTGQAQELARRWTARLQPPEEPQEDTPNKGEEIDAAAVQS